MTVLQPLVDIAEVDIQARGLGRDNFVGRLPHWRRFAVVVILLCLTHRFTCESEEKEKREIERERAVIGHFSVSWRFTGEYWDVCA